MKQIVLLAAMPVLCSCAAWASTLSHVKVSTAVVEETAAKTAKGNLLARFRYVEMLWDGWGMIICGRRYDGCGVSDVAVNSRRGYGK